MIVDVPKLCKLCAAVCDTQIEARYKDALFSSEEKVLPSEGWASGLEPQCSIIHMPRKYCHFDLDVTVVGNGNKGTYHAHERKRPKSQ